MPITGAAILVQTLKRAGVERIFTLSGNQILPIYDACLDHGIAVTDCRHEAAAAHMADAWSQIRGTPSVCLVSAGPGHTNAVTAMVNAAANESPVLWLSGGSDLALTGTGAFQEMDQVGLAARVCKAAWLVSNTATLPAMVARAWRTALEGRPGPVHLTLPADLLRERVERLPTAATSDLFAPTLRPANPNLVDRALRLLAEAKRPLVLAGPAAGRGDAAALLARFRATTGIPWLPLISPRGFADPAWHSLGATMKRSDVVLLLAPQDFAVPFAGDNASGTQVIQVAPTAADLGLRQPIALGLEGDIVPVLEQLHLGCRDYRWDTRDWRDQVQWAREAGRATLAALEHSGETPIHPLRLAAEVRAALPAGASVAQDGGEFGQWARWAFGEGNHHTLVNGKLGMLGPAIPYAIGAALARPASRSLALVGDGTFGFHGMELDTAIRHHIPVVVVVGNDAAWAAERHRQVSVYGEERVVASDLLPTRYDDVVRALGGIGEFVENPDQLRPTLQRALASGRPACVNVRIRSVPSPAAF